MDPKITSTLLSLLRSNPSTAEQFPLVFSLPPSSSSACGTSAPSTTVTVTTGSQVPRVGPLVNVINTSNSGTTCTSNHGVAIVGKSICNATKDSPLPLEVPIKVFSPNKKREFKTYMLSVSKDFSSLKHLRTEILDQLGKDIVTFDLSFDVGYLSGTHKIVFTDKDDVMRELRQKNRVLWCEGKPQKRGDLYSELVTIDSDSDVDIPPPKKGKSKCSAYDSKVQRVDSLANELRERHGSKYNKIQYKLWAEALDVKKHNSKEVPPVGPIWNTTTVSKRSGKNDTVGEMASAFTTMANSVVTALKPDCMLSTPTKQAPNLSEMSSSACSSSISPAKRIDLQQKLFNQIDLLHRMFERGALTSEYEKRRDDLLTQIDNL